MFNLQLFIKLLKQFFIVLVAYSICRFLFIYFNYNYFNLTESTEVFKIFVHGIRFDISAICYTNIPYFILAILPFNSRFYNKALSVLFVGVNSACILFNLIDLEYFKFTLKRSTFDIFSLISLGDDSQNLIIPFITDFWYILLIFVIISICINWLNQKIKLVKKTTNYYTHSIFAILFLTLVLVGARGGLQLKPIDIIHASNFNKPENANIALNTTFTIIKTVNTTSIKEQHYFSHNDFQEKSNLIIEPNRNSGFNKTNVVLIILESFSKKYVNKITTPFLDSLSNNSTYYCNSFANGKKSIEGIPAIIAGIPALMTTPFIQSDYATNQLTSIPNLLKKHSYHTSFYHGGNNGTMGFDSFSKLAGFDIYKGFNEYPNKNDYDGTWGAFDEPYLQYFAHECKEMKEPFFSTVFTLSSHHPYSIPKKHKNKFNSQQPIENTISYTDYALQQFFNTAKKMPWFKNTLFVITADHTAAGAGNFKEIFEIPIIFYKYDQTAKKDSSIFSHIDILPTIMGNINYPSPYFSFGKNIQTKGENYSVNYLNNQYQIINSEYILLFNGEKTIALYNHKKDVLLNKNLINQIPKIQVELENKLKLKIQEFNYYIINNKTTFKAKHSK